MRVILHGFSPVRCKPKSRQAALAIIHLFL
jgi:hypothetical protein